jgi:heme oxygenase
MKGSYAVSRLAQVETLQKALPALSDRSRDPKLVASLSALGDVIKHFDPARSLEPTEMLNFLLSAIQQAEPVVARVRVERRS